MLTIPNVLHRKKYGNVIKSRGLKKIRCSSDKNQTRVVVGKAIKLSGQVKLGNNNLIGPLTLAMAMAQGCYGITRGPLQYYDYEKYLVNSDRETMSWAQCLSAQN